MKRILSIALVAGLLVLSLPTMGQEGNRLNGGGDGDGGNETASQNGTAGQNGTGSQNGTAQPNGTSNETNTPPGPAEDAAGQQTVGGTGIADDVKIIITDNQLYGFTTDTLRNKRLGNEFSIYIVPLNGTVEYRVLIDELPLELGNGENRANATGFVEEQFKLPNLRRVNLEVELYRGTDDQGREFVEVVDFGLVRLRPTSTLAEEIEDDIGDRLEEQIRRFTPSEWTWLQIKWALVGSSAIVLGFFAGFQRGKEEEEDAEPFTVAT